MNQNLIGSTILGQFRVMRFIAAGGMSAVYQVWDKKRNVALAMKVLHMDLAEDPSVLKYFKREANALEKLTHPNIVPFYGLYHVNDQFFLLEAFVNGPTLKQLLQNRGKPYTTEEGLPFIKAISAALGYAHAHGVVHCDVKPGNVMIDGGGNIYLADFGIVRHAESTTTTLGGIGTPSYMAPEQIRGEAVTPATDVYALGIVTFEILTGRRPFLGETSETNESSQTRAERIRMQHISQEPPNPRLINPQLSPATATLLLKSLNKNPTERYQTCWDFFTGLCQSAGTYPDQIADRIRTIPAALTQTEPTPINQSEAPSGILPPAPPPSSGPAVPYGGQSERKNRLIVPFILGAVAIIIALGSFIFLGGNSPPIANSSGMVMVTSTSLLISALDSTTGATNFQKTVTAEALFITRPSITPEQPTNTPTITITPTNTELPDCSENPCGKIVLTCQVTRNENQNQLCMIKPDGSEYQQITNDLSTDFNTPSISPDGKSIVYTAKKGGVSDIYEMQLSDRTIRNLSLNVGGLNDAPEISSDGNLIVFTHNNGKQRVIYTMNRNGTNPKPLTSTDAWSAWDPTWSSDGTEILFTSNFNGPNELYVMNKDGSNMRPLTKTKGYAGTNYYIRGRSDWSPKNDLIAAYIGTTWKWEIFTIDLTGSNFTEITKGGNNLAPSFSPDGNWITFTSYLDKPGDNNGCEIYIMRLIDSELRRLTINNYCDWQPRWGW